MSKLLESLKAGDLKRLIRDDVFIDEYSSKMGENKDVITGSFKVTDRSPAEDLVRFLETAYDFILDADVSTGEKSDGDYLVFFEIPRTEQFPQQFMTVLTGVSNLTEIDQWNFKYKGSDNKYPASKLTLKEKVPLTAESFEQLQQDNAVLESMKGIARVPKTGTWDFYDSVKTFKGK